MAGVINESIARAANDMISMSDYKEGSATANYNGYCARFNAAVEELVKRLKEPMTEEQADGVEYWTERYQKKLAYAINRENEITSRCPSILISGGSNFNVRKKEKQNAAHEKLFEECGELFTPEDCYYFKKIRLLLTNDTIFSNDQYALVKLNRKLDEEEAAHAEMVKRNAYYRKHKTMKGYEGMGDAEAAQIDARIEGDYGWNKQPSPSWQISNSSARIRQIKARIAEIEKLKQRAEEPTESKYPAVEGVTVTENSELMRIQLTFEDKPDDATRTLLKSNGFKWAPSMGVWQRQLTANGIYATKAVLRQLSQKDGGTT